jgi:hypothetical protein
MRKKIFKSVFLALTLVLALTILADSALAVKWTFTAVNNIVTLNGYGKYYRVTWQAPGTTALQKDTVIINLPVSLPQTITGTDTTLFQVNVTTSDSAVIGVRYQVSSDNTTWKSYTIGTDSTTWYPGAYDADVTKAMNTFVISSPQYGGPQPYKRIMIVGYNPSSRTLYGWVAKLKVDIIPFKQN